MVKLDLPASDKCLRRAITRLFQGFGATVILTFGHFEKISSNSQLPPVHTVTESPPCLTARITLFQLCAVDHWILPAQTVMTNPGQRGHFPVTSLPDRRSWKRAYTAAVEQVKIAIDVADVIIFVVDVRDGVVPLDQEVAMRLRECGRPVLMAVNKADTVKMDEGGTDFASLGFEEIFWNGTTVDLYERTLRTFGVVV